MTRDPAAHHPEPGQVSRCAAKPDMPQHAPSCPARDVELDELRDLLAEAWSIYRAAAEYSPEEDRAVAYLRSIACAVALAEQGVEWTARRSLGGARRLKDRRT